MSAAFFQKLKAGANNMGEEITGPEYRYQDFIDTPSEQAMSGAGNFTALANDIAGLINYSKVITSGDGGAIRNTRQALGNSFFLKTAGKCKEAKKVSGSSCTPKIPCPGSQYCWDGSCWEPKYSDDRTKPRFLFFDNRIKGNVPFIRGQSQFKGLVPGMLENIVEMNPLGILTAFAQDATPLCKKIRKQHKSSTCKRMTGSKCAELKYSDSWREHYVALTDLPDEGFANISDSNRLILKNKPILNTYTTGFGLLLAYILYSLMNKHN